jgi:glycine oxidase
MTRIVIVGCGIVGAMVAYELSQHPDLTVTVIDGQLPGQGATGAALGILMGVCSQKAKGRNWHLRQASLRRYHTLLPELAELGHPVPHNDQGILSLCFDAEALPRWQSLQAIRDRQGWPLEIWTPAQVATACPHLDLTGVVAGIYSPQDRQIAPKALTQALVAVAQQRGVTTRFHESVTGFERQDHRILAVQTEQGTYPADQVVLTAGLGTLPLTTRPGPTVTVGASPGSGDAGAAVGSLGRSPVPARDQR